MVLPPKLAPVQVVVIPIWRKAHERETVLGFAQDAVETLRAAGLRVQIDDREKIKPGAKYYEWERKGTPLRLEVGPRDVKKNALFAAKRIGGKKFAIPRAELVEEVVATLASIQQELLDRALTQRQERTTKVEDYEEFKVLLAENGGWYLAPWKDDAENEARVKEETRATIRCYPLDNQDNVSEMRCFYSGEPATHVALFARAY